ncbi:uridine kinase [Legionella sp. PATHC035]|uniref:uridine kinase n=1 Tax=Legionella sp. PATHC035 TaxID=2992040 RepID=UPI002243FBAD|nr:uridine kinase [Legionella sp. PATHC035]MCW8409283.1 uridine kinase [Legionella sp. PATHC035]
MTILAFCGPIGSDFKGLSERCYSLLNQETTVLIDSSRFNSLELLLSAIENAPRDVIVFGPDIFLEEKLRAKFDIKVFVEMDSDLCLSNYLKTFKSCAEDLDQHLKDYFSLIQPLNEKIRLSAKFANLRRPQASSNDKLIDLLVDEKGKTLKKHQISQPRDMFWKPASQQQSTDSNTMVDSVACSKSEFNWDQ